MLSHPGSCNKVTIQLQRPYFGCRDVSCARLHGVHAAVVHCAGALKDNCRGLLVGSRTYGKGLIQSIYELHDASGLALTVRHAFLAPWNSVLDCTTARH